MQTKQDYPFDVDDDVSNCSRNTVAPFISALLIKYASVNNIVLPHLPSNFNDIFGFKLVSTAGNGKFNVSEITDRQSHIYQYLKPELMLVPS